MRINERINVNVCLENYLPSFWKLSRVCKQYSLRPYDCLRLTAAIDEHLLLQKYKRRKFARQSGQLDEKNIIFLDKNPNLKDYLAPWMRSKTDITP